MLALIIAPLKSISPRSLRFTPLIAPLFDQSMTNHHICPCCSYVLFVISSEESCTGVVAIAMSQCLPGRYCRRFREVIGEI